MISLKLSSIDLIDILSISSLIFAHIALRTGNKVVYMGAIGGLVALYSIFKYLHYSNKERVIGTKFFGWINMTMIMCALYGTFNNWMEGSFSLQYHIFLWISILSVYLIMFNCSTQKLFKNLDISFTICLIVFIIYLSIMGMPNVDNANFRLGDESLAAGNSNTVAMNIGLLSSFLFYHLFVNKNKKYLLPCIFVFIFSMLTGSKKGLIIFLLYYFIFNSTGSKFKFINFIKIVLVTFLIVLFVINNEYMYNHVGYRVVDAMTEIGLLDYGQESYSTQARMLMYKIGINAFLENPFFGGGWFYFSYYSRLGTYSHNNYIELLVTFGVIGFLLYYSIYVYLLQKISKVKSLGIDNKITLLYTMIVVILFLHTAAVSFSYDFLQYFVLTFGFLYVKNIHYKIK